MANQLTDSEYAQLIGRRIRAQRALGGIPLAKLESLLARTPHPMRVPVLSRIENGSRSISVVQAKWIAYALGMRLDVLLEDPDEDFWRETLRGIRWS